jgi:oxygen-independent coproporphyrinogen-3 oxidase
MSGIYIHVPFCKRKCDYCDFYSIVPTSEVRNFSKQIAHEIKIRNNYLANKTVDTIYFGGGTPSMLSVVEIESILNSIARNFRVNPNAEITIEANPDDLSLEYLQNTKSVGFNRISIGIQSFNDNDLKQLGRRHNALQAISSVQWAYRAQLSNISIDLIYGLPYSSTKIWEQNLRSAFDLPIKHLSCYHLIFEENTPLFNKMSSGGVRPVNEDLSVEQFEMLQKVANQNHFIHYEISNLALEGYYAQHNSSYWKQVPYLGLGPSAHSYNGTSRSWNPRSIKVWSEKMDSGVPATEVEELSPNDMINDYFLTSLRTIWGADLNYILENFGGNVAQRTLDTATKYAKKCIMNVKSDCISIKPEHFLVSDGIIVDFLV